MRHFLYWTPRVLAILMAAFISVFALDVFGQGYSIGQLWLALLMHLLPTIVLVGFLVVAWRREKIGGYLFMAFGLLMGAIGRFELTATLVITLPLVIVGGLFLLSAYRKTSQIKRMKGEIYEK